MEIQVRDGRRLVRATFAPPGVFSLSSSLSSEKPARPRVGFSFAEPTRLPQRHLPARTIRLIYVMSKHGMKWGSMASKCAGRGVPFGYDPQRDRFVWLSSVPLDRYGERCGLVCPSCGGKLQAVRTATNTPHPYYKCFRHSSLSSCGGGFESQLHRAVKSLLADSVGREFRLPMVSLADAAPHASRISDSGRWVHDWRQTFEQDDRCVYPEIWVPYSARKSTIEAVEVEMPQENGLRPDVVLTLKDSLGNLGRVAVEIRVEHPKSLEDAVKFSEIGLDVIELNFGGIDLTSEDCESLLQRTVFGDLSPRCQRDMRREWLWTARAVSALENYHPYVDTSRSDFSGKERAQFPYIGRHAHVAVAKGAGEETWNDLTKLCAIVDKIDREADSEAEELELDSFGTIETDSELPDMADEWEGQANQPDEAVADGYDGSISGGSKGEADKKRWWQRNPLSRFLSRFK